MSLSRMFFYFCLSFLLGVFLASFSDIYFIFYLFLLVLSLIIISIFYKREVAIIGACCLVFCFGLFWEEKFEGEIIPQKNDIHFFNEKGEISFEGIISQEPKVGSNKIQVVVANINILLQDNKVPVNGKVLVILSLGYDFQYGDKILIKGRLRSPVDFAPGFNWKEFLRKDQIYSVVYNPKIRLLSSGHGNWLLLQIFRLKKRLIKQAKILPPPEGAILEGITLGEEGRFSRSFKEKLSQTGLSHISAVSGMNITILFSIFFSLLVWIGFWRKEATIFTIFILIFYVLLVGASPSAIRAGIMGSFLYLGYAFGRLVRTSRLIVFTATAMVAQNPLILTRDIGFQLSFLALLGLVYLAPLLERVMKGENSLTKKLFSQSLAAQAFCLPLLIFNFGRFSLLSPFCNILVLPIIPFLTGAGFLFLLLGALLPSLSFPSSFLLYPFLKWIVKIVETTSSLPGISISLKVHWILVFIIYSVIFLIIFRTKPDLN